LKFSAYLNHPQIVISKGVSEARVQAPFPHAFGENGQISGRVALRDLVFTCQNKRSLAPIRALKTARPHGRDLGMTTCLIKRIEAAPGKIQSPAKAQNLIRNLDCFHSGFYVMHSHHVRAFQD
jgi:hypothetical protein